MSDWYIPDDRCTTCGDKFRACPECKRDSIPCVECEQKTCFDCLLGTKDMNMDMTWAHVEHQDQEDHHQAEGFLCDACADRMEEAFESESPEEEDHV